MKNFFIGTYLLIKNKIIILPESVSILFKTIRKFILESPYLFIGIIIFFFVVFFLGYLVGKDDNAVEKAVKLKESGKAKKVDENKWKNPFWPS